MTKRQRNKVYKQALKKLDITNGICDTICSLNESNFNSHKHMETCPFFDFKNKYPELYSFKPKGKEEGDLWWNLKNIKVRAIVLEKCIKLTEPIKKVIIKKKVNKKND